MEIPQARHGRVLFDPADCRGMIKIRVVHIGGNDGIDQQAECPPHDEDEGDSRGPLQRVGPTRKDNGHVLSVAGDIEEVRAMTIPCAARPIFIPSERNAAIVVSRDSPARETVTKGGASVPKRKNAPAAR